MTEDPLSAGWELDRAINTRVFHRDSYRDPAYSTDLATAWEIVEHMVAQPEQELLARFAEHWHLAGNIAPRGVTALRICRAALAALEDD